MKKGFTLIELMVVIAIIGLLSAIALPKFTGITKDAELAQIQANTANLRTAIRMWEVKNGDHITEDKKHSNIFKDDDSFDEDFKKYYSKSIMPTIPKTGNNAVMILPENPKSKPHVVGQFLDSGSNIGWVIDPEDGNIYPAIKEEDYGVRWNEIL